MTPKNCASCHNIRNGMTDHYCGAMAVITGIPVDSRLVPMYGKPPDWCPLRPATKRKTK